MKRIVSAIINGERRELAIEPFRSLLDVLRDEAELTGSKKGCDVGDCGACTVLLDGMPVNSCLVLGVEADGSTITTIEGLAEETAPGAPLHPLQESILEHGGGSMRVLHPWYSHGGEGIAR